jgi:hypothetical protein
LDTRTRFFCCLVASSSLDGCLWLSNGSCCVSRITSTLDMADWGKDLSQQSVSLTCRLLTSSALLFLVSAFL